MNPLSCVLTGDLLGSTKATMPQVEQTFSHLQAAVSRIEKGWFTQGEARFTRSRGDGWQAFIPDPALALRSALYLFASLKSQDEALETRIALGFGPVERLGDHTLSDAYGPAFTTSGRLLDKMPRGQILAVGGQALSPLHEAVALLIGDRLQKWSREQAEAVALSIDPSTDIQADVAARLGVTVQAVNARLSAAGYPALQKSLDLWDQTNKGLWHA